LPFAQYHPRLGRINGLNSASESVGIREMKPTTHGGKRPGAGRKRGRKTVLIRVYDDTAKTIKRHAVNGHTIADVVDQRLW
jgi:hypothetical protein